MPEGGFPRQYYRSAAERDLDPAFLAAAADEFPEPLDLAKGRLGLIGEAGLDRRDFLKLAGFAFGSVALAACHRAPAKYAIPLLDRPEDITPGRASWYATTCAGCTAGCGALAKVRDGRPIKLEGNPEHPLSRGGLCAVGQASVLSLYDSQRLHGPRLQGRDVDWAELDRHVSDFLDELRAAVGGPDHAPRAVRLLTGTITSPSARDRIAGFLSRFQDGKHVQYDALSASAIREASRQLYGAAVLPRYDLAKAEVIVAFEADFLGTWISPVEHTAGWREGRAAGRRSWHCQLESRMSLSGAKADLRIRLAPEQCATALAQLYRRFGGKLAGEPPAGGLAASTVEELARRLAAAKGRSLVLCGSDDPQAQALAAAINQAIGNVGATVLLEAPSFQKQGDDAATARLLEELREGKVAALIIQGVNPVYDLPEGAAFAAALAKVPLVLSFANRLDETAALASAVAPEHHFLEAWNDAEPVAGLLSLGQPAIGPLGKTRSFRESLAAWMGEAADDRELIRRYWKDRVDRLGIAAEAFDGAWERAVHDGFARLLPEASQAGAFRPGTLKTPSAPAARPAGALALVLYAKVGMPDGRHAHNPWLQELPDPVSKVSWDNYACLSPATAAGLGVKDGDVLRVRPEGAEPIQLPAFVQPGQDDGVLAIALGYGRAGTERFAKVGPQWLEGKPGVGPNGRVGVNAAPLLARRADGSLRYAGRAVTVERTGRRWSLASTQDHHSLFAPRGLEDPAQGPRPMVREFALGAVAGAGEGEKKEGQGQEEKNGHGLGHGHGHGGGKGHAIHPTLWPDDHPKTGRRWGMAIDLDACTGCGGCVLACQAENNVPVVGRDEVLRHREMHWIRIDRYYADPPEGAPDAGAAEVVFQPMLCQHCEHAPCETVCPVLATVHSSEGLNQQVYNRCVGTRYCANNCPYKVRRFNWFDYPHDDKLANLALNPDITVRSRGVMEKCSFCVQRIQEAKATRSAVRRIGADAMGGSGESGSTGAPLNSQAPELRDGDVRTACEQSCPARAIVFGDLNDPASRVSLAAHDRRAYHVLDDMNLEPSVSYLGVTRSRPEAGG